VDGKREPMRSEMMSTILANSKQAIHVKHPTGL